MKTIELQLDEETFERARRPAEVRREPLESLIADIIERLAVVEIKADPLLGMFADDPDIMDQVIESAMMARELHPLEDRPSVNKVLLDTDIFSEILKGINQNVVAKAIACFAIFGGYTISTITVMEIVKGLHNVQHTERIQQFLAGLSSVELLSFGLPSAELAGRIYADLERTGQPIGRADPMIAGIALQHDLTLITGNLSHYQRIQTLGYGLRLDNWRQIS